MITPTCQEVTELVTDYLEGRLAVGERLRFQLHLGVCPHCRAYLDQMQKTAATLGRLTDEEKAAVPDDVKAGLLAAFRGWKQRE